MKLALLTTLAAGVLAVAPSALVAGGGNSIAHHPDSPTTVTGVSFTVTTGGNKDNIEVGVVCTSGYATRLTVTLDASGAGSTATIYPPVGGCTATIEKGAQIGRFHVLATDSFAVS
jgi:hypothetical protein